MDEQTKQTIQILAQVYMQVLAQQGKQIQPQEAMQAVVQMMQKSQRGDEQATEALQQLVQIAQQTGSSDEQEQGATIARHGAKLAYIRRLKNKY